MALCVFSVTSFAQDSDDIALSIDASAQGTPLPKIFQPSIDLSGRGFNRDMTWPQNVADKNTLKVWQQDIGWGGMYRLQYNLWEVSQLSRNEELQAKLEEHYEGIIKAISDSGGVVILDLFGTPAGLGRVLDVRSPPRELRAFKEVVKKLIRKLSCQKRYNIWYEVWSSPDLEEFYLGKRSEYLHLYRMVAESAKELEAEYKMNIPVGGPAVSWWFQNSESNTIMSPENSLIYDLIRFCYHYRLPLDFVSWYGYSTDPFAESANTAYRQTAVQLVRNWLQYLHFDKNTPLIVDEWNYDRSSNMLQARQEKAYIAASYIPSRMRRMQEAGIDYQLYFCLEDFKGNREGVVRNVGIFSFDAEHPEKEAKPKAIYAVYRMINSLGKNALPVKLDDPFLGCLATKTQDGLAILLYNYIDPDIAENYISRNIAPLNSTSRKIILNLARAGKLNKVLNKEIDIASLKVNKRLRALLKSAVELSEKAKKFADQKRKVSLKLANLKSDYLLEHYRVDSSCAKNCDFSPFGQKETGGQEFSEEITLPPYSVQLIVLKEKPKTQEEKPQ